MKKFLILLIFFSTFQSHASENFPEKYVGVWATKESVFNEKILIGGLAFYLDKNGTGVLIGGPVPAASCSELSCAKLAGMRLHASIGANPESIVLTPDSLKGEKIQGIGLTYDSHAGTLIGQVIPVEGKIFTQIFSESPDEIVKEFYEKLSALEKDQPANFLTYEVPSHGMEPTLMEGQAVYCDSGKYQKEPPQRGDIVAYKSVKHGGNIFIQRVIALSGDKVAIKQGKVFVNDNLLTEPYVTLANASLPYSQFMAAQIVPAETIFLLGDNRDGSLDSRFQGVIAIKDVAAKVFMVKQSLFEGEFRPIK